MILVTGGAGFIGANFVLDWLRTSDEPVVNLDALTYAGNLENLASLKGDPRHIFVQGDICDRELVDRLFAEHRPRAIVHFAAESHVDRSIHGPGDFVRTNVNGTFTLLEAARGHWMSLDAEAKGSFRFHHVSTDEVYGSLEDTGYFYEDTRYDPSSPYSASKAASDHLVRAWARTFKLPITVTNCSNNYGPRQFPEKLVPLMILNMLERKPLPIYGKGTNVRDWLYVDDHVDAIWTVIERGKLGETYNVGGHNEKQNIEVIDTLATLVADATGTSRDELLALKTYVTDRPGHDHRYAIDASKIEAECGWKPAETFETGMKRTVTWYLENKAWIEGVRSGDYRKWIETNYAAR